MNALDRRTVLRAGAGAAAAPGLAWLLAACGGGAGGSGKTSSLQLSNDKPTWQAWFGQEGVLAKKATGASWAPREYSDEQVYEAAIKTSGTRAPDMFTWQSSDLMRDLVDAGYIADLSRQWDQQGDVYSTGLRDLFTFGGKTYGAPLYFAPWVVYYNKHVFDQYQLTPPATWDELQHILATLKKHGIAGLAATVDGIWSFATFQNLLVASSPALYQNLLAGKAKYTDPGVVDVMNLWRGMLTQGYFTDPSAVTFSTRGTNVVTPFKQGKAAMIEIGTWFEATFTMAGLKPGTDYGAFVLPRVKDSSARAVVIESGPLCVAAHGQHRADAVRAAAWFMSRAGQQAWVKLSGNISGRSDVAAASQLDSQIVADVKAGNYQQVGRYYEGTPETVVQTAISEFQKFLLHPGDPMPILAAIQQTADTAFKPGQ